MSLGYMQQTRNPLLVKDDVGKAKPSCYDLPTEDFAFGRPDNPDLEGAREVTMQWVSHVARPRAEENIQDFRKLNKLALKEKLVKARDLNKFRKENDVTISASIGGGPKPKVFPSEVVPSFTYGKQTRPSTPIAAVISNQFAAEYEQAAEENYAVYERERMEVGSRKIKTTKATEGHALAAKNLKQVATESKEPFKLTKFKNIKPKVQFPGGRNEPPATAETAPGSAEAAAPAEA